MRPDFAGALDAILNLSLAHAPGWHLQDPWQCLPDSPGTQNTLAGAGSHLFPLLGQRICLLISVSLAHALSLLQLAQLAQQAAVLAAEGCAAELGQ